MTDEIKVPSKMKMFGFVVVLLAAIFLLNVVGSVFSTATTVVTAPGKVLTKTLDTNNIITSYEWFYDTNAAYDARMGQVTQFKSMYKQEEDKDERYRIRIEMAAMMQTCRDLATKYNANSNKMNKSIFKGWSLPPSLSSSQCS